MKKKSQEKVDAKILANRQDQRERYRKRMADPAYRELIREKRRRPVDEMTPEEAERQRAKVRERVRRHREKERLEAERLAAASKKNTPKKPAVKSTKAKNQ